MAEIKVTTSEVRNKAAELRNLNGQFKSKVEALVTSEGNLSSMWEGEAKTAFHNAFNTDKTKWDEFSSLIDKYAQTLDGIADEYDKKEAANAQIASNRSY